MDWTINILILITLLKQLSMLRRLNLENESERIFYD
jgi:hypothetical protein